MRVTKDQIINGIVSYAENEVIPQVGDKATQIIAAIAVKSIKANTKLIDSLFENPMLKTLLEEDADGTYELDIVFGNVAESIRQYGPFPIEIPPIPFVSNSEKLLTFTDSDVNEIKRRIERSN